MTKEYINENLAPGNWGYFFVILSFSMALASLIAYFFSFKSKQPDEAKNWIKWGRGAFIIHFASVVGIFSVLFYLIYSHQFQYYYVYSHSSKTLPVYYMAACFWEGQEGSFLLWTFWHGVLGCILIWKAKEWESSVLIVLALVQLMLSSMLLGLKELDIAGTIINLPIKLGSNPFILFRNVRPELPLFSIPDYATKIQDGNGLNPLLQNYWMVIHPPVLFLGFASTIIPFCFAIAGLMRKKWEEWVRVALPWSLFNGMILGTGVLMGGAWAYEALSFGGFWAWDPVENASLVPWLIAVSGLHTLLIYKSRKTGLRTSYFLVISAFLLILYSTFLTRSGILGNSSVHSFTDLGLSGQLLIFMFLFILLSFGLFIFYYKKIPQSKKEESIYSREFWMFIGVLILGLMALHIISLTSIPVLNKINEAINKWIGTSFPTKLASPADPIKAYHQLQIPLAIFLALLTGFGQFFKYIKTDKKQLFIDIVKSLATSLIIVLPLFYLFDFKDYRYFILLFAGVYSVVGNFQILLGLFKKVNVKGSGPAIAHIGVGLILLGALISNGLKRVISINTEGFAVFSNSNAKEQRENKVLYKDFPVRMQDYVVTYITDSPDENHIFYKVNYRKFDSKQKDKIVEEFNLFPYVIYDIRKNQITAPSPDTRHYFSKDIFTHITAAVNKNDPEYQVKYDTSYEFRVKEGEVFKIDSFKLSIQNVSKEKGEDNGQTIFRVALNIKATDGLFTQTATPSFILKDNTLSPEPADMHDFGLQFVYKNVDPSTGKHDILVFKGKRPTPDFITLKAIVFPWINVLWIGSLIMIIGFLIAIFQRVSELSKHKEVHM